MNAYQKNVVKTAKESVQKLGLVLSCGFDESCGEAEDLGDDRLAEEFGEKAMRVMDLEKQALALIKQLEDMATEALGDEGEFVALEKLRERACANR